MCGHDVGSTSWPWRWRGTRLNPQCGGAHTPHVHERSTVCTLRRAIRAWVPPLGSTPQCVHQDSAQRMGVPRPALRPVWRPARGPHAHPAPHPHYNTGAAVRVAAHIGVMTIGCDGWHTPRRPCRHRTHAPHPARCHCGARRNAIVRCGAPLLRGHTVPAHPPRAPTARHALHGSGVLCMHPVPPTTCTHHTVRRPAHAHGMVHARVWRTRAVVGVASAVVRDRTPCGAAAGCTCVVVAHPGITSPRPGIEPGSSA